MVEGLARKASKHLARLTYRQYGGVPARTCLGLIQKLQDFVRRQCELRRGVPGHVIRVMPRNGVFRGAMPSRNVAI